MAALTILGGGRCTHRNEREDREAVTRPSLTIFYTSDLRGQYDGSGIGPAARGGLARRATLVDRARVEGQSIVQVDAGNLLPVLGDDTKTASRDAVLQRAHMILAAYRRMGVDVVVPGPRELALGAEGLRGLAAEEKTPMVASNILAAGGQHPFPSERLLDAAGHQIGVFGILDLSGEVAMSVGRWGFTLEDPVEAARRTASSLRARGAALVIAVVRTDRGEERAKDIMDSAGLWRASKGVDVVVVSPDATAPTSSVTAADRKASVPALVPSRAGGTTIGRLDVRWPRAGGAPQIDDRTTIVTGSVPDQWGVALIERLVTTHVVDDGHLANAPARNGEPPREPHTFERWDFGSTASCAACHLREDAQWKTTDHAHALETLRSRGRDRDPACLGCHLTGFLAPGGTRNLKTATTFFADVGCESCHGASAEHVRARDRHMGTSRTVDPTICLGCHTADQNRGPFNVAEAMKEVLGPGHGLPGTL